MTGPGEEHNVPKSDETQIPERLRDAWRELPQAEPPDLVDQAVLNRARAAVTPREGSKRPWSFGWLHALTTAAVIVLAVTLIIPQRDEAPPTGPALQDEARFEERADVAGANRADESQAPRRLRSAPAAAPAAEALATEALSEEILSAESVPEAEAAADGPAALQRAERQAVITRASKTATRDGGTESDVEARLRSIREMVANGEREAAREAALAFTRDFPDIDLPEDLAPLLPPARERPDP